MRIGIFSDAYLPNISGVVTSITMLSEGLRKLGHEVLIFTLNPEHTDNAVEFSNDVYRFKGYCPPFRLLKQYRINLVLKNKIKYIDGCSLDIIHVHTEFSMGKLGALCAKKLGIPLVYTLHTLYEDYLKYVSPKIDRKFHKTFLWASSNMLIKPLSRLAQYDIVPTNKVKQVAKRYNLQGEIKVVPTGIELDHFKTDDDVLEKVVKYRNKYGIKEDDFVFLYLGRISEEKSIDIIIEAFSKSLKGNANAKILVVGDGPALEGLKNMTAKYGVESQVIFTGFMSWADVPAFYHLANVFVNASISETQGLTYIEALAASCPILVQIDSCLEEVVIDYYNGIFFDGIKDLSSKMSELVNHPAVLKRIAPNTAKSVEKFSKMCYANNILKIYQDAIIKYNSSKR